MPTGEAHDAYKEELIEKIPLGERIAEFASRPGVKTGAGSMFLWMALRGVLDAINQRAERGIQREAIRGQRELATPENLYYQAALPSARAEEETARQALFAQLSGGVIGPSLAKGERIVGGS